VLSVLFFSLSFLSISKSISQIGPIRIPDFCACASHDHFHPPPPPTTARRTVLHNPSVAAVKCAVRPRIISRPGVIDSVWLIACVPYTHIIRPVRPTRHLYYAASPAKSVYIHYYFNKIINVKPVGKLPLLSFKETNHRSDSPESQGYQLYIIYIYIYILCLRSSIYTWLSSGFPPSNNLVEEKARVEYELFRKYRTFVL